MDEQEYQLSRQRLTIPNMNLPYTEAFPARE
jgi:hypothetical protein